MKFEAGECDGMMTLLQNDVAGIDESMPGIPPRVQTWRKVFAAARRRLGSTNAPDGFVLVALASVDGHRYESVVELSPRDRTTAVGLLLAILQSMPQEAVDTAIALHIVRCLERTRAAQAWHAPATKA